MIPFLDLAAATAELRDEIDAAVARVLDGGWFVLGPETEGFERAFAQWCRAGSAVGVASGLDAVEIALRAVGVRPGDEVVVPSHTFVATWLAVSAVGATPIPVEPRSAWAGLDPDAVSAAITPRTTAIVVVDMHGHPADAAALLALAERHGLALVRDAAQSHGASRDGRRVGGVGHATAFSFYPAKNLGAIGDGGAIVTDDPAVADRARRLRNYGGIAKHDHGVVGTNARLDELQAAILSAKLPHLDAWNVRRASVAERYRSGLADLERDGRVLLPEVDADTTPSWHLFSLLVDDRDAVRRDLTLAGVETGVHYPVPPHRTGAYAHLALPEGALPVAERIAATTLSLPIGPHLPDADVDAVIERVRARVARADLVA